jgi:hypothetical protein
VKAVAFEVIVERDDGSKQWLLVRESDRLRALNRALDYAGSDVNCKIGSSFHECPEAAARVVIAHEAVGAQQCS